MTGVNRGEILTELERWLTGELEYGARQIGYLERLKQMDLPIEDELSLFALAKRQWQNFRKARQPEVAQLQLAKFAACMFDKAGVALWLFRDLPDEPAAYVRSAEATAEEIIRRKPWEQLEFDATKELRKSFNDTAFAPGIRSIMADASAITSLDPDADFQRAGTTGRLFMDSVDLGAKAVACYVDYTAAHASPRSYALPISLLS